MNKNLKLRRIIECAIFIAIGTVLSVLSFESIWALGGSITIGSMVPLIFIAHRHGTKWGLGAATVYGVVQMLLGMSNVMYGENFWQVAAIIALDYVVAYGVIGLAAMFDRVIKNQPVAIALGVIVVVALRFGCHFLSGWIIWDALWPNELGWASPYYSLIYNAGYMVPELIITLVLSVGLYFPLKKYYYGKDLER